MEDHPHACGDKLFSAFQSVFFQGSSPCVWGQDRLFTKLADSLRIIPMRVGTRYFSKCLTVKHRDHPHACGDKMFRNTSFGNKIGSSPCVWGQVLDEVNELPLTGIIPMRVGTRRNNLKFDSQLKDHPHACGDKLFSAFQSVFFQGSSPCVWGQATDFVSSLTKLRIIPMRVGTSRSRKYYTKGA